MIKIADITLGQVLHTDSTEPLDVTNKGLHVHTPTGENVDLASVLSKLTELDNKIDAISNADNMNVSQVGSKVVLYNETSSSVAAGASYIPAGQDVTNYREIGIVISSDSSHSYTAKIGFTNGVNSSVIDKRDVAGDDYGKGGVEKISYTHVRPIITNNDSIAHTYSIYEKYYL